MLVFAFLFTDARYGRPPGELVASEIMQSSFVIQYNFTVTLLWLKFSWYTFKGVLSLFDGDTQSVPGWQNRIFSNIVRPMIPQRLEVMIVQLAFTPLQLPNLRDFLRRDKASIEGNVVTGVTTDPAPGDSSSSDSKSSWLSMKPRYTMQPPPRFLKLSEDKPEIDQSPTSEPKNKTLSNAELSASAPQEVHDQTNGPSTDTLEGDKIRDKEDTDQVSSPPSKPIVGTEHMGSISQIEPKTVDRSSQASSGEYEEQPTEENPSNLDSSNTSNKGNVDKKVDVAKIDGVQAAKIDGVQATKTWLRYFDVDEDDEFSTKLGPITTRKDERTTMLPKQMNANGPATNFIIV